MSESVTDWFTSEQQAVFFDADNWLNAKTATYYTPDEDPDEDDGISTTVVLVERKTETDVSKNESNTRFADILINKDEVTLTEGTRAGQYGKLMVNDEVWSITEVLTQSDAMYKVEAVLPTVKRLGTVARRRG